MAIKVKRKTLITIGVVVALAVVAYFAWNWYQNNQANNQQTTDTGVTEGTNLNSVNPDMSATETGGSGLTYTAPSENVTLNLPNGNPSVTASPSPSATTTLPASPSTTPATQGSPAPTPTPAATVVVPNVVGMTLMGAGARIAASGLKYAGPRGISALTKTNGQSPAAGTKVAKGSTVTVRVK